jgi:hypothetical protein
VARLVQGKRDNKLVDNHEIRRDECADIQAKLHGVELDEKYLVLYGFWRLIYSRELCGAKGNVKNLLSIASQAQRQFPQFGSKTLNEII